MTANSGEQAVEPQPQVHHPWMSGQQQSREQPRQQIQAQPIWEQPQQPTQEESQPQIQETQSSLLKSLLDRINGWSTKKKILWGVVAGFLFLVCVGAALGDPEAGSNNSSSESTSSEKKQELDNKLANEFGCQWIMDTYRPFADLGREMAVLNLSTEMTLKRDNLTHIGTGDAAEALRTCEAAGHR